MNQPILDQETEIHIVAGGQFGSEAKGHVCQILTQRLLNRKTDVHIRVGGPNAGHTVYDEDGQKFAFRHLPVAAVLSKGQLVIGPGSEVDFGVLKEELDLCDSLGHTDVRLRLWVSPHATILSDEHKAAEVNAALRNRLGSTAKGIGAARADRLWRTAKTVADHPECVFELGARILDPGVLTPNPRERFLVEGTQGYGLGLHAGFYPFCTAGDCRNVDFLAQSGLPPCKPLTMTWLVFRSYPIRVAGNSGPLFQETSWEQLNDDSNGYIQPEQTTVTKLTRRVGCWDRRLAREALEANGGPSPVVFPVLTFVDYLDPDLAGCFHFDRLVQSHAWEIIRRWEDNLGCEFELFTTGPETHCWRQR